MVLINISIATFLFAAQIDGATLSDRCLDQEYRFSEDGKHIWNFGAPSTIKLLTPDLKPVQKYKIKDFVSDRGLFYGRREIYQKNSSRIFVNYGEENQAFAMYDDKGRHHIKTRKDYYISGLYDTYIQYRFSYETTHIENSGLGFIVENKVSSALNLETDLDRHFRINAREANSYYAKLNILRDPQNIISGKDVPKNHDIKYFDAKPYLSNSSMLLDGSVYIRDAAPSSYATWFNAPDASLAFRIYATIKEQKWGDPNWNAVEPHFPFKEVSGHSLEIFERESNNWRQLARMAHDEWVEIYPSIDWEKRDWLYARSNRGRDKFALVKLFLGDGHEEVVFEAEKADITSVNFNLQKNIPVSVSYDDGFARTYFLDEDIRYALIQSGLNDKNALEYKGISADRKKMILKTGDGGKSLGGYVLLDIPSSKYTYLNKGCAGFLENTYPNVKNFSINTEPFWTHVNELDFDLLSYLSIPETVKTTKWPLIIWLHGGPHERETAWEHNLPRFFASLGFATLRLNYRGSTGLGKKYYQSLFNNFSPNIADDILHVLKNLRKNPLIDVDNSQLVGFSAGAWLAYDTFLRYPDSFSSLTTLGLPADYRSSVKSNSMHHNSFTAMHRELLGLLGVLDGLPKNPLPSLLRNATTASQKNINIIYGADDPRGKGLVRDNKDKPTFIQRMISQHKNQGFNVKTIIIPQLRHSMMSPQDAGRKYLQAIQSVLDR